jgi:hypothetical protein
MATDTFTTPPPPVLYRVDDFWILVEFERAQGGWLGRDKAT